MLKNISATLSNNDMLTLIYSEKAKFAFLEEGPVIEISYGERQEAESGDTEEQYMAFNTEYHPANTKADFLSAMVAFNLRLFSKDPTKPSGFGKTLENIFNFQEGISEGGNTLGDLIRMKMRPTTPDSKN